MVDRSTCAMSTSLRRRPLTKISVFEVAKAPKPRKSTEVFAPFAVTPYSEVSCTPGTCPRMSGRLYEGERAMSCAVITVDDAPTIPLNCRTPVPAPPVSAVPGLVPSEVPVPAPRDGSAVRAGRVVAPLPSLSTGRARVLFGSVGEVISTGGSVVGSVCARTGEPHNATMLVARSSALRRFAVSILVDMITGLGMTSVARHSEPDLTLRAGANPVKPMSVLPDRHLRV